MPDLSGEGDKWRGAKRGRKRAQKLLVLGRKEQHCSFIYNQAPLATISLKHLLILLIRSAASAAMQTAAICACNFWAHNPNCRRLVGHGHNSLHLLGGEETWLHAAGSTGKALLYPSLLHNTFPCPQLWPMVQPLQKWLICLLPSAEARRDREIHNSSVDG